VNVTRLFSIGRGPMQPAMCWLGWSRLEVLTDLILRQSRTLAPQDNEFEFLEPQYLPANYAFPERYVYFATPQPGAQSE